MKYNLGILKNRKIGFCYSMENGVRVFSDVLLNTKQTKDMILFQFVKNKLEVKQDVFYHLSIEYKDDTIWFVFGNQNIVNGLVGFTMFDTYGFPIEMTQEILKEKGFDLDIKGFEIIRNIQKEVNSNTFKNKSAFL